MIILGIETSCDETAASLLEIKERKNSLIIDPRANVVASQIKIHQPYGGVVPTLASREHLKNISSVLEKTFQQAHFSLPEGKEKIDLIAVTSGPGLIPALLVGVSFARALAWASNKPIIGINHMEGHLLSFLLPEGLKKYEFPISNFQKIFPAIILLVSGGHTQLIYERRMGDYKIIGQTRDDAAGECFDKGARILGLSYPGGPAVAAEAEKFRKNNTKYKIRNTKYEIRLPRPMINSFDYDFSFSGLKTALLYLTQKIGKRNVNRLKPYLSFELEEAITEVLVKKTLKAALSFKAKSIILGGGVSANKSLREKFRTKIKKNNAKINFFLPSLEYTGDNAIMISLAAFFHYRLKPRKCFWSWENVQAQANWQIDEINY